MNGPGPLPDEKRRAAPGDPAPERGPGGHPAADQRQAGHAGARGRRAFYVPWSRPSPRTSSCWKSNTRSPGDGSRLDYPDFPASPAVQEVLLAAYLPQEWALLGKSGPWTERFSWELDKWWRWKPVSHLAGRESDQGVVALGRQSELTRKTEQELLDWLRAGLGIRAALESFPTDGRLYVFSALDPVQSEQRRPGADHSPRGWLHGLLFAVVVLGGVLLVPARAVVRALVAGVLLHRPGAVRGLLADPGPAGPQQRAGRRGLDRRDRLGAAVRLPGMPIAGRRDSAGAHVPCRRRHRPPASRRRHAAGDQPKAARSEGGRPDA